MFGCVRSNLTSYISSSPNQFFLKGNHWCYLLDDGISKLGQHSAGLGKQIAKMTGNSAAEQKCSNVSAGFAATRDGISAVRFIPTLPHFISGQAFLQTNSTGWRKVAYKNGSPIRIPHEELTVQWIKVQENGKSIWKNSVTNQISTDGIYIDDPHGRIVARDWMDIVMAILIVIARVLAPVRWLHHLKAIDLGKHVKAMSGVVMGVWGTVLTLGFVQSVRDLIQERDLSLIKKRSWDAFQGCIDLISIPFDFGVGSGHTALAIVGAGVNILSAGSLLIKEANYY